VGIVLSRSGDVWRVDERAPRRVVWDKHHAAFETDTGARRATHQVRGFDGGALLASDGGVIAVGSGDPVFHAAPGVLEPARLARVGASVTQRRSGPHVRRDRTENVTGPHARKDRTENVTGPHARKDRTESVRKEGTGVTKVEPARPAVVAMCGPNAWIWSYSPSDWAAATGEQPDQRDAFWVVDLRDW
jgi:hypothetical protein